MTACGERLRTTGSGWGSRGRDGAFASSARSEARGGSGREIPRFARNDEGRAAGRPGGRRAADDCALPGAVGDQGVGTEPSLRPLGAKREVDRAERFLASLGMTKGGPQVGLEEGVRRTIAHYRERLGIKG